eukprot:6316729-Prymnesium_polylepis.1
MHMHRADDPRTDPLPKRQRAWRREPGANGGMPGTANPRERRDMARPHNAGIQPTLDDLTGRVVQQRTCTGLRLVQRECFVESLALASALVEQTPTDRGIELPLRRLHLP